MSLHDFALLLHILGACVVVGVVFFSLVFSVSKPLDDVKLKAIALIRKYGVWAMGVVTITGIYMATSEWDEFGKSYLFWAKIALIVIDYFVAVRLINAKVAKALSGDSQATSGLSAISWTSALIFLIIVTLGFLLANSK